MSTRSLTVGPIGWSIAVEPSLDAVMDHLLEGVTSGGALGPIDPIDATLQLDVVLTTGRPVRRELPRLPSFVREGDNLVDRSQGWDATLCPSPGHVQADFTLVDTLAFGDTWAPTLQSLNTAAALRVSLGMAAPMAGALLFHAAALDSGDGALLFLGASGQGKTTMVSRLPAFRALSDDAALVWRDAMGWWVSGTPLPGKERLPRSLSPVRLRGLVFLEPHALEVSLTRLPQGEAAFLTLSRLLWFAEPTAEVMALTTSLVDEVGCYRLRSGLAHDVYPPLSALCVEGAA